MVRFELFRRGLSPKSLTGLCRRNVALAGSASAAASAPIEQAAARFKDFQVDLTGDGGVFLGSRLH